MKWNRISALPPKAKIRKAAALNSARQSLSNPLRSTSSGLVPPFVQCHAFSSSSSGGSSNSTSVAFDRNVKRLQRDNAARSHRLWRNGSTTDKPVSYDYFREEIARRLVDRLDDIRRDDGFPLALDIGSGPGYIYKAICADDAIDGVGGIGGVRKLVQLESSKELLHRDADQNFEGMERCGTYRMEVEEEEDKLPFPDGTFDLVISCCALHWVNNLPGLFKETHVSYSIVDFGGNSSLLFRLFLYILFT